MDVELIYLEKSLQIKRQMTKELHFCEQMINSMKVPIEELYKSPGDESLQLDLSGEEIIKKEYVAPIGGDTLPPGKEIPPKKEASPKEKRSPRKAKTPQKYLSPEETSEKEKLTPRKNWSPIHLSPSKTRPDSEERHVERQGVLEAVETIDTARKSAKCGLYTSQTKILLYNHYVIWPLHKQRMYCHL